jgi:hypothetical protein
MTYRKGRHDEKAKVLRTGARSGPDGGVEWGSDWLCLHPLSRPGPAHAAMGTGRGRVHEGQGTGPCGQRGDHGGPHVHGYPSHTAGADIQITTRCCTISTIWSAMNQDGSYDGDKDVNDNCDYDSDGEGSRDRNWAIDWQSRHVEGAEWYGCTCGHSQALNCNQIAYAVRWLGARLAGWGGATAPTTAARHPRAHRRPPRQFGTPTATATATSTPTLATTHTPAPIPTAWSLHLMVRRVGLPDRHPCGHSADQLVCRLAGAGGERVLMSSLLQVSSASTSGWWIGSERVRPGIWGRVRSCKLRGEHHESPPSKDSDGV